MSNSTSKSVLVTWGKEEAEGDLDSAEKSPFGSIHGENSVVEICSRSWDRPGESRRGDKGVGDVFTTMASCGGDRPVWLSLETLFAVSLLEVTILGLRLGLKARLRPGRLITAYWQSTLRLLHREQVGFSLGHLTLDSAQAWQLSRSLEGVELEAAVCSVEPCVFTGPLVMVASIEIVSSMVIENEQKTAEFRLARKELFQSSSVSNVGLLTSGLPATCTILCTAILIYSTQSKDWCDDA